MAQELLTVIVRARDKEYYNGPASAVSSENKSGPFDILPKHAHFISLVKNSIIIHKPDRTIKNINFTSAALKVKDNLVEIYIGLERKK